MLVNADNYALNDRLVADARPCPDVLYIRAYQSVKYGRRAGECTMRRINAKKTWRAIGGGQPKKIT